MPFKVARLHGFFPASSEERNVHGAAFFTASDLIFFSVLILLIAEPSRRHTSFRSRPPPNMSGDSVDMLLPLTLSLCCPIRLMPNQIARSTATAAVAAARPGGTHQGVRTTPTAALLASDNRSED